MRPVVCALLVLAVGLAGCLAPGEPLDPDRSPAEEQANATADDGEAAANGTSNATSPASGAEGSAGDGGNDTVEASTGEDGPPDAEARGEPAPRLPGNLTMDAAEVVERTDQRVAFLWEGALSTGPESARFDVPPGLPLHVNASLAEDADADLDVRIEARHVDRYCTSNPAGVGLASSAADGCQVRTFARSSWDAWNVTVFDASTPADTSSSFRVELAVEVADAWEGPPVEAPTPSPSIDPDPGWPPLEDAEVRPGVKVGANTIDAGVAGHEVNDATGTLVLSSPDNRTLYLAWVAHGVPGLQPGDKVPLPTVDAEATLVYCSWGVLEETATCPRLTYAPEHADDAQTHPRFFNDVALLRLPDEVRPLVHPAVPLWGGPTGIADPPEQGDLLRAFGNTPYRDGGTEGVHGLDPKLGTAWSSTQRSIQTHLAPPAVPGDSGSPVVDGDGAAVGPIAAIGAPGLRGPTTEPQPEPAAGTAVVPNLANALEVLHDETALEVELATWPLFEVPRVQDLGPSTSPPQPAPGGG